MDDYTHRMLMNKLIDLPVTRAREERASEKHQWDIEDRGYKEAEKMFELFKTNVAAGSQEILQSGDSSGIDAMITALDTRLKVYDEAIAAKKPIASIVSLSMVNLYITYLNLSNKVSIFSLILFGSIKNVSVLISAKTGIALQYNIAFIQEITVSGVTITSSP